MRRLIESLTPADRPIAWTWIGTVFALYLVAMAGAVTLFTGHRNNANLAQEAGVTVAAGAKRPATSDFGAPRNMHHLAHFQDDAIVLGSE
jgi:hypothetical protein